MYKFDKAKVVYSQENWSQVGKHKGQMNSFKINELF